MAFQFLNANELLKCSVLRNFTSSLIEARVSGIIAKKIFKLKTAFLLPSPSYLLNSPIDSWRIFSLKLSLPRESFLPGKHKLLFKMTCFFLLKCQESEEHVIPQMTTLKKFQLPLRHALLTLQNSMFFRICAFFARFYSGFYFSYDTRVISNVVV